MLKEAKWLQKYLIELGHSRIGGVFYQNSIESKYREQGYKGALKEHSVEMNDDFIIYMDDNISQNLIDSIKKEDGPTAFVCFSDDVAISCMRALRQNGISVPEDDIFSGV